jgi:hypothetical protein
MQGITDPTGLKGGRTGRMKTIAAIFGATLILAGCGGGTGQTGGGGGGGGNPNPVQPGTDQKIHLVWKKADNAWKVKLNGGPEEDPRTAKTELAKGVGPTKFEVDIQADGPSTISFKNPGGLSVWTGSKSTPQAGINSTQILGPTIDEHGHLIFWDLNQGDPVTLYYSLHFNEAGVPSVDPIVDNGGGNSH